MNFTDLPIHVGDGSKVDCLVSIFGGGSIVLFGDLLRGIDIPMGFVKMNELNKWLFRIAFLGEPVDGFGSDDICGEAGLGAFGFSIPDPSGFVAHLGVIVGAKVVVEAVEIHGRDVMEPGFGAVLLDFD